GHAIAAIGGDRFQIRARAKRPARAGQDRDRESIVGVETAHRAGQRRGGGPIDGVARLGTVDSYDCDFALDCELDQTHRMTSAALVRLPKKIYLFNILL